MNDLQAGSLLLNIKSGDLSQQFIDQNNNWKKSPDELDCGNNDQYNDEDEEEPNSNRVSPTVINEGEQQNFNGSITTFYEPKFLQIFKAYNNFISPNNNIDTSCHLMSLCLEHILPFCCWARESNERSQWIRETLEDNTDLRPEVRNGLSMIVMYAFSAAKSFHRGNVDMFYILQESETGLGIVNKTSLKIYNDPFNYFGFLKTCVSGLIDAGKVPENERHNQPKKSKRMVENKEELIAFFSLKTQLVAMLNRRDNLLVRSKVQEILNVWHLRTKSIRNRRFVTALSVMNLIPQSFSNNINSNTNVSNSSISSYNGESVFMDPYSTFDSTKQFNAAPNQEMRNFIMENEINNNIQHMNMSNSLNMNMHVGLLSSSMIPIQMNQMNNVNNNNNNNNNNLNSNIMNNMNKLTTLSGNNSNILSSINNQQNSILLNSSNQYIQSGSSGLATLMAAGAAVGMADSTTNPISSVSTATIPAISTSYNNSRFDTKILPHIQNSLYQLNHSNDDNIIEQLEHSQIELDESTRPFKQMRVNSSASLNNVVTVENAKAVSALRFEKVGPKEWDIQESRIFNLDALLANSSTFSSPLCFVDETKLTQQELKDCKVKCTSISGQVSLFSELNKRGALITSWTEADHPQLVDLISGWQSSEDPAVTLSSYWTGQSQIQQSILNNFSLLQSSIIPVVSSLLSPNLNDDSNSNPSGYIAYEVAAHEGIVIRACSKLNIIQDCWRLVFPTELYADTLTSPFGNLLIDYFPQIKSILTSFSDWSKIIIYYYPHKLERPVLLPPSRKSNSDSYQTIGTLDQNAVDLIRRFELGVEFHDLILEVLD